MERTVNLRLSLAVYAFMKTISRKEFDELTQGAEVLAEDRHGLKVLVLPSGEYLKLFRRKRLISSALWCPYSKRFASAAKELQARDIPTVKVCDTFRVKDPVRDVVRYEPLEGRTLRQRLDDGGNVYELLNQFVEFLARLHASGVYFRAIHAANVIVMPDGAMGLIDVSEAQCKRGALGVELRARNFKHVVRYEVDTDRLVEFGVASFFRHYIVRAGMSGVCGARLMKRLPRMGHPFEGLR
jgi:serine/threonine protein kinase